VRTFGQSVKLPLHTNRLDLLQFNCIALGARIELLAGSSCHSLFLLKIICALDNLVWTRTKIYRIPIGTVLKKGQYSGLCNLEKR
jgi:hypothetical protein